MSARKKSGYLPSLDGWRAVAILSVLIAHDRAFRNPTLHRLQEFGAQGVFLFFAISGFLIAWRIQEEESLLGVFHIRAFYVRRLFRIQPASLAYLAVIAVMMAAGLLYKEWPNWWGALLSYRNFQFNEAHLGPQMKYGWFTAQFWTLSVEEHFYVLLSLFFLFVKQNRRWVFAALLTMLLVGQAVAAHVGLYTDVSMRRSYWVLQFLFFASLLAIWLRQAWVMELARKFLRPWIVFAGTVVAMLVSMYAREPHVSTWSLDLVEQLQSVFRYAFSFWVIASTFHPESWTTRALEWKPLRMIGRMSYSLYLWQQMFFHVSWEIPPQHHRLNALAIEPLHFVLVFAVAAASYFWLEKPMMRLGHKLAPPASPGHRDLAVTPSEHAVTS